MRRVRVSGTENYAEEAADLLTRYEAMSFAEVHRSVLHLIPAEPCRALDIGAGTGRDAAGLAAMGHRVLAVEPTEAMRSGAMALHPSPLIEWLDDSLPDLALVRARGEQFDILVMTAVWMHLDEQQRRRGMPHLAQLVRDGGVLLIMLRHGPVAPGRRMFAVSGEETIGLALPLGLRCVLHRPAEPSSSQPNVSWTRLAFTKTL